MALKTIVKTGIDGSISLSDDTAVTPLSLSVQYTKGDLSLTGTAEKLNSVIAIECRGKLASIRHSSRIYPQITFSALVAEFSEDSVGTLIDAVQRTGVIWGAAISTTLSKGDVYTLDTGFDMQDVGDEIGGPSAFVAEDTGWTWDFSEADDGNSIAMTGVVYGDLTGDISATEIA